MGASQCTQEIHIHITGMLVIHLQKTGKEMFVNEPLARKRFLIADIATQSTC